MSIKALVIRDEILGDITIPIELTKVVAQPLFQRLRGIGQTGLLYLIYPGMTHSRFEHSLGAMHLSIKWFDSIMSVFQSKEVHEKFFPISKDLCATDGSKLLIFETEELWKKIISDKDWKLVLAAAALLHDVGHGPFSHSIESYGLLSLDSTNNFTSQIQIKNFIKKRQDEIANDPKKIIKHEDFSVILAYKILSDAEVFPDSIDHRLYVCALIFSKFRDQLFRDTDKIIPEEHKKIIKLMAPLISGLFDVDRMDYMRRDSTKAGVKYGLSEVQRLMSSLIPTLILEPDNKTYDVNIITRARNIHSIDHFLVGLFQLYTTLYMHPSYEGYQHELGLAIKKLKETKTLINLTVADYEHATDSWLISKLNSMGVQANIFDKLVSRSFKDGRKSFQTYSKTTVDSVKYQLISGSERAIIKDGIKLWLIDQLPNDLAEVRPWDEFSLVARNLKTVKHTPYIWWANKGYVEALEKIVAIKEPTAVDESKTGTD